MIHLVIPAYNEQENIGDLLENILRLGLAQDSYRVLVVDDGSTDGTRQIVDTFRGRMPVSVVSHAVNQGVGAGFRTGFETALRRARPEDVVVTMEADNTSDLGILPDMLALARSQADLVLASCYAPGGRIEGTNLWRKVLSWGANLMLVAALPIRGVHTYSSFYRAYRAGFLSSAMQAYGEDFIRQAGFVCMVEVLVKLDRLGARIAEVPMVLDINRRKDASKMRIWRTIRDYLAFISADLKGRRKQPPGTLPAAKR